MVYCADSPACLVRLLLCPALQFEALEAKLCQLLGRSLYVDEATAKFYLEEANGDIKAAMEAFGKWQRGTRRERVLLAATSSFGGG